MRASIFVTVAYAILGSVFAANPQGIDVSGFQPNVNWASVKANGVVFAYIKATESTTYKSPAFNSQYNGATNSGIIRGAYHFAQPSKSSGAAQATYFLSNGGGWSNDGITLPGALDLETGCHGLSQVAMVNWIKDFSNTYHAKTNRYPVLYTTTNWWKQCTGDNASFGNKNPLWIARYNSDPGSLPSGWNSFTFWQYADHGPNPGDADVFNGDSAALKRFVKSG
jgi:GH25 family lysozyme M1 (1,4-beta-N-acetylmuramidase)